jgi:hypothetical protein
MEGRTAISTSTALQELFLLGRDAAVAKVNAVFDDQLKELCLKTRFPREVNAFVTACLVRRGELERGAGSRCFFIRDRQNWQKISETQAVPSILIADPALDFETHRSELLKQARLKDHGVIYGLTSPRPDIGEIVDLRQPHDYEVEEVLKRHFSPAKAKRLAVDSSGNIYLLSQLLSGTTERRKWASADIGPRLRHLALLGGWNDTSARDKASVAKTVGEPYDTWVSAFYPFTRQEEPPIVLEGSTFRAVSRYELWQQLGPYLSDADLQRFAEIAMEILCETEPRLELPKGQRQYAAFRPEAAKEMCSSTLRRATAETLALLAGQNQALVTSAGLATYVAENTVQSLLAEADWKRWASLSGLLSLVAEAAPDAFLSAIDHALNAGEENPVRQLFEESEDPLFGRTYHAGLLWALEVLAWHQDYLSRVALSLARMVRFPLPQNMANNALNSLRSIFLTWLPQTLASVEQRLAAVKKVTEEYPDVGWKLLLAILPEGHQTGSYNPKPVWRNWFDKEWTGEVTRHEMMKQVVNYADLAVKCAVENVHRLDELVERWDHLPREAVDEMLKFLTDPAFKQRPEKERFVVWERLVNEVQKHRRYAKSDWAMPEEELKRLEAVAAAIEPESATIRNQRLFDDYDAHFFESDDYETERAKLSKIREDAVREIMAPAGPQAIIDVARRVKMPAELGEALGRIGDDATDSFLLPIYLLDADRRIVNLVRGYVWARYFKVGARWAETYEVAGWSFEQKATFFAFLPFHAAVWRRAEQILGPETSNYWKQIYPNAFQARDDLQEAVQKAIEYKRGDIAVSGINCLRFNKQPFPISLALAAVKALLANYEKGPHIEQHELLEAIKLLQQSNQIDIEELSWIEFQSLNLLDRFSGAAPVVLEKRLANDPKFFHTMVTRAFRSENVPLESNSEPSEKDEMAGHVFRLLYRWQTPPGTLDNEKFDEELLKNWINEVEKLCKESGHWKIAQQLIGTAFVYAPLGVEGLLKHPSAAKILDRSKSEEMRRGFTTGLFNLRGVHGYTAGKEELQIANSYHQFADRFEIEGFVQIATTLRRLSESYRRESEREAKENPYDAH